MPAKPTAPPPVPPKTIKPSNSFYPDISNQLANKSNDSDYNINTSNISNNNNMNSFNSNIISKNNITNNNYSNNLNNGNNTPAENVPPSNPELSPTFIKNNPNPINNNDKYKIDQIKRNKKSKNQRMTEAEARAILGLKFSFK